MMEYIDIRTRIQKALASFWWCPESYTVVERPEVAYVVDPTGGFNQVARIDDQHPNLSSIISEISTVYRNKYSSVITFPEQNPELFYLLQREGYRATHLHDIRYKKVHEHEYRDHKPLRTIVVQTKTELVQLLKTSARAFGKPYIPETEEAIQHMLREYNCESPRAIRVTCIKEDVVNAEYALGAGGMSLFPDLDIATFFGGGTIPQARGQGVYAALVDARLRYAQQRGISIVGIYARHGTSAPIVAKQGFLKCGEMQYWERNA